MDAAAVIMEADNLVAEMSSVSTMEVAELAHVLSGLARQANFPEVAEAAAEVKRAATQGTQKLLTLPIQQLCAAINRAEAQLEKAA